MTNVIIYLVVVECLIMKKEKRNRLSVDLEPYPDVAEMLDDACEVLNQSATMVTITALKHHLAEVVRISAEKIKSDAEIYEWKHGRKTAEISFPSIDVSDKAKSSVVRHHIVRKPRIAK